MLALFCLAHAGLFDGMFGSSAPKKDPLGTTDPMLLKWFQRESWTRMTTESEKAEQWMKLSPVLGINCPKVGLGYFWYESLQAKLRGVKATSSIMRGEEVCFVPVQQMLCEFSVGNSSLRDFMSYYAKGDEAEVSMKAALATFVIREGSRESSRWMPYIKALLDGHDPKPIPATWPADDARFKKLTPYGQKLATQSRARALRQYSTLFPAAFSRFGAALGEGIACAGSRPGFPALCQSPELASIYTAEKFVAVYSVLRARDWVLDMHGEERPFLAPTVDLLNFGQVGIRASYDNKRGGFVARTVQPIKAGAELLFYYGNFCIDDAVSMYGFAPTSASPCKAPTHGKKRGKLFAAKKSKAPLVEAPSGRRLGV